MQVVILTGGNGALLRPLTFSTPKSLLPLLNQPILQYVIRLMIHHQADDIIIASNTRSELISDWINQQQWPVPVRLFQLQDYQGSAQVLWQLRHILAPECLVIFADTLIDLPFTSLFQAFRDSDYSIALGLRTEPDPFSLATVQIKNETVSDISDSTHTPYPHTDGRFYFLKRDAITAIGPTCANIFPDMLSDSIQSGKPVHAIIATGYWAVLGRLSPYLNANFTLLSQLGSHIDPRAQIHPNATLHHPVFIGPDCRIAPNATVGPFSILGPGVSIDTGSTVHHSLIFASAQIASRVAITHSVIGYSARIAADSRVSEGCIVGAFTSVGTHCLLNSGCRIGPNIDIPDNQSVDDIIFPPYATDTDSSDIVARQQGLYGDEYEIFRVIFVSGDISDVQLSTQLGLSADIVQHVLTRLLNRDLIVLTSNNTYCVRQNPKGPNALLQPS